MPNNVVNNVSSLWQGFSSSALRTWSRSGPSSSSSNSSWRWSSTRSGPSSRSSTYLKKVSVFVNGLVIWLVGQLMVPSSTEVCGYIRLVSVQKIGACLIPLMARYNLAAWYWSWTAILWKSCVFEALDHQSPSCHGLITPIRYETLYLLKLLVLS